MHHISNFCCVKANWACSMLLSFLCLRKVLTRSSILACIFWVFPSISVNISNGLLSGRVILWQLNCLPFSYLKVKKFQQAIVVSSIGLTLWNRSCLEFKFDWQNWKKKFLLPDFANSLPCWLSHQNWAGQQGRKLAKSGSNKKNSILPILFLCQ